MLTFCRTSTVMMGCKVGLAIKKGQVLQMPQLVMCAKVWVINSMNNQGHVTLRKCLEN